MNLPGIGTRIAILLREHRLKFYYLFNMIFLFWVLWSSKIIFLISSRAKCKVGQYGSPTSRTLLASHDTRATLESSASRKITSELIKQYQLEGAFLVLFLQFFIPNTRHLIQITTQLNCMMVPMSVRPNTMSFLRTITLTVKLAFSR